MIFTVAFMALWATLLAAQINIETNKSKYRDGLTDWTQCLFSLYDGTVESTAQCGTHPK
jgi:hypothetical protein